MYLTQVGSLGTKKQSSLPVCGILTADQLRLESDSIKLGSKCDIIVPLCCLFCRADRENVTSGHVRCCDVIIYYVRRSSLFLRAPSALRH